jgi:hypothetical protein
MNELVMYTFNPRRTNAFSQSYCPKGASGAFPHPAPANFCHNGDIYAGNISMESLHKYELNDVSHMQMA